MRRRRRLDLGSGPTLIEHRRQVVARAAQHVKDCERHLFYARTPQGKARAAAELEKAKCVLVQMEDKLATTLATYEKAQATHEALNSAWLEALDRDPS